LIKINLFVFIKEKKFVFFKNSSSSNEESNQVTLTSSGITQQENNLSNVSCPTDSVQDKSSTSEIG
jgi:hypothetical protein